MDSDFVTFDETAHIGASASYVATGDFRLNPEHPPLVKILAGLAMAPLRPSVPVNQPSWREYNEWDFGRQFLFDNRVAPERLLAAARIPVVLITLLLIASVTAVALRWFGPFGAVLTGLTAAFDPTILAHGHLVTTDVAGALGIFAAVLRFGRFLDAPSRRRALIALGWFAFAILTKFSTGILLLILPVMALARYLQLRAQGLRRPWPRHSVRRTVLLFLGGALAAILLATGFQTRRPIDDPRINQLYRERELIVAAGIENARPDLRVLVRVSEPGTRTRGFLDALGRTPIPAYPYWRGMFSVISHSLGGHGAYLLGQSGNRGWWYYFPVAFAVKTPSGTLVLTGLLLLVATVRFAHALRAKAVKGRFAHFPIERLGAFLAPALYFGAALTSHLNLGVRHLAPVYPFLFLGIGSLAAFASRRGVAARWWSVALLGIALTVPLTTALEAPHFLPAFNTFVGGSKNGSRYLADSNLDWAQDVRNAATVLAKRGIQADFVTVFTNVPVERYFPNARSVPTDEEIASGGEPPGWYVASFGALLDPDRKLRWLRGRTPAFTVGNSIGVFRLF